MAANFKDSSPNDSMLAWLAAEPADDPVDDLRTLRTHLPRLIETKGDVAGREALFELLDARVLDVCGRFKPRMLASSLPLPRELYVPASDLIETLLALAAALQSLAERRRQRWIGGAQQEAAVLAARGLRLVGEAFLLACMGGFTTPFGLWQRAYALLLVAGVPDTANEGDQAGAAPAFHFKRLVALSVLQPETLTVRELVWVADYLDCIGAACALSSGTVSADAGAYWMDPALDSPPVAFARRAPPQVEGLIVFSAAEIAEKVAERIESLEDRLSAAGTFERDGEPFEPEMLDLPAGLTPVEILSLLRRLRSRWASPPVRRQPRRRHQYSVQVCAGLRAIWAVARGEHPEGYVAEWLVYNESPGGYAIMCVAGVVGALSAGMALGLRRDAGEQWTICVVRWIRSENPDQVELGLQVVAQACTPVAVVFRGGEARATVPALVLPPVAALRRNQAMLVPAGTYSSRRFLFVHDGDHLYVAQGKVLSLDMQTANVELFQYEVDPYPT